MNKQLHLNLFIQSRGHHEASWRHHAASELPITDIRFYIQAAKRAEEGLFDSIFLADQLSMGEDAGNSARTWLEPLTVMGALAVSTQHIGLIATASTTYNEPYNLARQFSSLDHISRGRVGWNIVTSWSVGAAGNYGDASQVSHAERYERAEEFVTVAKALWDSWDDDAVIDDRDSGRYADQNAIRRINHVGPHYRVSGPLNIPRCPQGRPVFVQAGSSDTGRNFAARHAEAVFTAHLEKRTAKEFYTDIKARAVAAGRQAEQLLILPGLSPVIASTQAEALRYSEELNALADPEVGRRRLSGRFGDYDFSRLPLDRPLTADDFPDPSTVEAARSRAEVIVDKVKRDNPTLRELLATLAGARGHFTFAGTPDQVADLMEDWFTTGACDGFNLMPPIIPHMVDVFVSEVVPILQRRGLFRTAYNGATLRDHFRLGRPAPGQ
jgi:FMN-dependent oxidoreductase (nitrilotriacetate monooxygenase family)